MKKWVIVAVGAAVAALGLYLALSRPSEEDRIRATLNRLAKAVAVKEDDTLLSRMARLRSELKEVVDDGVAVDVPDYGIRITGRDKLVEDAAKVPMLYQTARIDFVTMDIKTEEGASQASVEATAVVTGTRSGERKIDKRPVHFLLRKDGSWRVSTIKVYAPNSE